MKNLLEYLNLSLEFINSKDVNENIIMAFLNNIRSVSKGMSLEEMEEFGLAFDALALFYEREVASIKNFETVIDSLDNGEKITDSFQDKFIKLDDYETRLCQIANYMGNVNEIIKERMAELRTKAL